MIFSKRGANRSIQGVSGMSGQMLRRAKWTCPHKPKKGSGEREEDTGAP